MRYYDEEGYEVRPPARPPRRPLLDTIAYVLVFAIVGLTFFVAWPSLMQRVRDQLGGLAAPMATPALGNVGGQAPPDVRGVYRVPVAPPAAVATPIPGIAQSQAEAEHLYQAAIDAANQVAAPQTNPTPALGPLPLNSAGAPIIDAAQQQQLDMSAQMAADEQQAAQRAAVLADAQGRAPDVSYEDARALLGRDPCHVPHADPHTCARGLYKPTPIGAP